MSVEQVLQFPAQIVASPIRLLAWMILKIKERTYDPEKIVTPCCGFRGDSGTNGKTCAINFMLTTSSDRANIQHTCLRCGCDKIFTKTYRKTDDWLAREVKVETQKGILIP